MIIMIICRNIQYNNKNDNIIIIVSTGTWYPLSHKIVWVYYNNLWCTFTYNNILVPAGNFYQHCIGSIYNDVGASNIFTGSLGGGRGQHPFFFLITFNLIPSVIFTFFNRGRIYRLLWVMASNTGVCNLEMLRV